MGKKQKAKLIVDGRELELDVIVGSEGERAAKNSRRHGDVDSTPSMHPGHAHGLL